MSCQLRHCFLDANGTLNQFNGEGGTIAEPGSYEIIQSCDVSQTTDWFRVVAKLGTCTPGVNSIVAVYVFFNDMMISVNSEHDIWVSVCIKK